MNLLKRSIHDHNVHSPLTSAPGDLLIEIATHLESRSELLSLCFTSTHVYSNVVSVLYGSVQLSSVEQCRATLRMLRRRPDIARHVRELTITLKSKKNLDYNIINREIASSVRDLATTMRLDALTKFIWDADEMPYHEDMWFALRMGCPQLRYIGTSFGKVLPNLNSHLFDFVDLIGFSLTLTPGFYDGHAEMFLDEDSTTAQKLWNMLINRCPNLEELTIDGVSSTSPTDAHTLALGRWPRLRKLTLGDVSIDWVPGPVNPTQKRPFITFLEAHPDLESLALSKHAIQPGHFASLEPTLLRLTSFSGTLQQLQALPHLHPILTSVTFNETMQTREVSALAVASLLQSLSSLTELRISFTLHSMYDSGNLLRSLLTSCPHLHHLELTCGNKPSFQLESFSKTIRSFYKLRTLRLTIVKYPGDETLACGAARIARNNPRLKNFTLTFIPPTYPLPLPFALPYIPLPTPIRCSGSFTLSCDKHGLPLSLSALEDRQMIWPWGLGTSSSTKRYVNDLRPLSSPGRRKGGIGGLMNLALERTPAGEEMRMILFCGMLVCLAMWGFMASGRNSGARQASSVHTHVCTNYPCYNDTIQ